MEMYEQVLTQISRQVRGVLHFGAHIGQEASLYERCGIKNVAWVEPNPELLPRLKANVEPLGHRVIPVAVGGFVDVAKTDFHVSSNDGGSSSLHRFSGHEKHYPSITMEKTIQVPRLTIQSIVDQYELYDHNLWYFDIQGGEYDALFFSHAIQWCADFVYAEIQFEKLYEGTQTVVAIDSCLQDFTCLGVMDTGCGWGEAFYQRQRSTAQGMWQRAVHRKECA